MDELPSELLACIAERCDIASLKALRLVDKTWSDLCTPLVLQQLHIGLFDHSLAKFQALAASRLAKHVKKFTFYCDVLPDYTRIQWEKQVESCLGHGNQLQGEIDAGWHAYQSLLHEQQNWRHSEQGKAFQDSFLKLRNLRDVAAIRAVDGDENANEWPLWTRLTKQCIVGPDQWKNIRDPIPLSFMDSNTEARGALALLEAMGERISQRLPPITKLQLQLYCRNFYFLKPIGHEGFAHPVHSSWPNSIKPKIRRAFANLTDLSLYLETPFAWEEFGGILADFSDFLYYAKKLRRLNFWFEYSEDFSGNWPDELLLYTDQIGFFGNDCVVWPEIEHLALKVNIPSSKLLKFLKYHSGTLQSLELRHMLVRDAPLLLEGIPKILELNRVYVQGLWHYGPGLPHEHVDEEMNVCLLGYGTDCHRVHESWMRRYLLRETDRMPDLRDDPLVRLKSGYGMNQLEYEPVFEDETTHLDYSSVASEES